MPKMLHFYVCTVIEPPTFIVVGNNNNYWSLYIKIDFLRVLMCRSNWWLDIKVEREDAVNSNAKEQ